MTIYQQKVDEFRRIFLQQTLVAHGGNRTRTAKTLGMQRTYLLRLIKEFHIDVPPATRHHNNHGSNQ